jgi:co-chaperonin GroES (HSP10)
MVIERSILDPETTPIDAPDADITGFNVKGHLLVVQPVHIEGKTKGGIILAQKTKDDIAYLTNIGKVLKVGPSAYTQAMFDETGPWCKEGDYVLLPRLAGQKIRLKGVPLILVGCDKVIATLDNPKDIDPNFNIGLSGIT